MGVDTTPISITSQPVDLIPSEIHSYISGLDFLPSRPSTIVLNPDSNDLEPKLFPM